MVSQLSPITLCCLQDTTLIFVAMTLCSASHSALGCAPSFLTLTKGKKRKKQNKGSIPLKTTLVDISNE